MMKNLAEAFEKEQEIRKQYDEAKDEAGKEAARTTHKAWENSVAENGIDFWNVYRLYSDAKERGNEYIDLRDCIWDKDVPALISNLRVQGIKRFTFSSSWSSAVETAWLFQQNGCTLEGLVEINGQCKDFHTGEYEKVHGYIFRIN